MQHIPPPYYIFEHKLNTFEIRRRKREGEAIDGVVASLRYVTDAELLRLKIFHAHTREVALANAQFIVEACNSHDVMVDLITDMMQMLEHDHADEIQNDHYGDALDNGQDTKCTYCQWLSQARKVFAGANNYLMILRAGSLPDASKVSNGNHDQNAEESDKINGDKPLPFFEADDAQPSRERLGGADE